MERAGNEDMSDDVERKGLGTPATRADIIEKGKKGSYDAYLIPKGIDDYSYTKDGKEIKGSQYKVKLEFQKSKK